MIYFIFLVYSTHIQNMVLATKELHNLIKISNFLNLHFSNTVADTWMSNIYLKYEFRNNTNSRKHIENICYKHGIVLQTMLWKNQVLDSIFLLYCFIFCYLTFSLDTWIKFKILFQINLCLNFINNNEIIYDIITNNWF